MTAQVIRDVNADILGVVEAESRPALEQFCDEIVDAVGGTAYEERDAERRQRRSRHRCRDRLPGYGDT